MNWLDPKVGKLIPVPGDLHKSPMLLVADYKWWNDNREEIESWMQENLPQGIKHLKGMLVVFDCEEDRAMFMLRFGL